MNEKIIKQIKSLPPLPKSVMEVQRITNDPNSSISDLVKVIKEDPMLIANLLKAANSPLYGFTRQIKTVDQAVSLFGMTTVKGFVISFAVRNTLKFDLSAYGIDENRFHDVSIRRNALALNWYRTKRDKLDIIATDSFLIDLGAVIISLILVGEGRDKEFRERLNNETVVLGGLISSDEVFTIKGVPVLKEIPLIKYIFSSKEKISNKKELVFVITPKIFKK